MMAEKEYLVPHGYGESEYEERRSVFLGHAAPVQSEEEAKAFILSMKTKYADARHNVWAYCLRNGIMRSSDDGEPSGTGGAPVLDSIVKKGLTDTAVVVTRYFGGILLGTGGLVRAYSTAAADAIKEAGVARALPYVKLLIVCSYGQYGKVTRLSEKQNAKVDEVLYGENVSVNLLLPARNVEEFTRNLKEQSCGELNAVVLGRMTVREKV